MRLESGGDTEGHVGRRAHVEADLLIGQPAHQIRLFDGPDPVLDPVGSERLECAPHRLGTTVLARMGGADDPG